MPRVSEKTMVRELAQIAELLAAEEDGANRDQIGKAFAAEYGLALPPRTLQRRLERLIVEGRARTEGALGPGCSPSGFSAPAPQQPRARWL